ncbi:MAG: ABC transporter permease [Gammaproteobacteria bacterium]|nr:ABC transporter permease [Gammaproteobacteria bacterium]
MRFRVAFKLFASDLKAGELNLLALALIVAVGTVTIIGLFSDQIRRAILYESNSFLAADRVISGATKAPREYIDAADALEIDTAELLGFVSMIYFEASNQLASVKAVSPGYPLRGEVRINDASGLRVLASGQGHPQVGEAWVDRLLKARLGLELGDTIEVGLKALEVTGIILSEPDPSSGFMDFAPRLTMNWADIEATQVVAPGSQLSYRLLLRGDEGKLEALRDALSEDMQGRFRWRDVRDSGERLGRVIDRAQSFIMLGGLLAVALGGVAISLCADRYAWRRAPQVAILKTLGARPRELYSAYAVQFLLIALVAVLFGWLLGFAGHSLLTALLGDAIPVHLPAPSFTPLVVGALTGILCLIAFALPSIMALGGVSPMAVIREDLAKTASARRLTLAAGGLTLIAMLIWYTKSIVMTGLALASTFVTIAVFGLLAVLLLKTGRQVGKRAGGALRLALSSLSRHPLLNATHIGVFAMPICVLFILVLLQGEVLREWRNMLPRDAPNHFVLNITATQVDDVKRMLDDSARYQGIVFPMARGRITAVNGAEVSERPQEDARSRDGPPQHLGSVRNFSASQRLPAGNELVAGTWWEDVDQIEASLDEEFARWNGLDIGDVLTIDFEGRKIRPTISNLRKVDWDSFQPNFYLLVTPEALKEAPSTYMASFHVPADDPQFVNRLLERFPTLSVFSVDQLIVRFRDILDKLSNAMELLVTLVLASAALVMLASIATSREVRMREYGLLRTLGGSSRLVRSSLLLEFAGLGLFAGLAAAIATEATLFALQTYLFEMPHQWHPLLFVYSPLLGLVLIALLGVLGSKRMMNVTPVAILREAR